VTERAAIIDGARAAEALIAEIARDTAEFTQRTGVTPGLALVAIDDEPAQRLYVRKKIVQCERTGMRPIVRPLKSSTTTNAVVKLVRELNADPAAHGIFVQWPLPGRVDLGTVAHAIAPAKDIDGMGSASFAPAAVLACVRLLRASIGELAGVRVTVVSGSDVFTKPIARILREARCEVTLAARNSEELAGLCRRADVLIVAAGEPEIIRGEWIKPGAIVIDAGVNAIADRAGRTRHAGDVNFEQAARVARAITPVPGGVGPMTIACLLENTLAAAKQSTGRMSHG
jgi:methylenetetrahydrofolate dehydrogenase (NADP+)/methenyltetrahydrofolate cyclohydrolase